MSCVAQASTFRLLDSLVGWDPGSVQGIGGLDRELGISLEQVANPWSLADISRALPLTYLNEALRKIAFDGATIFTIPHEMLILALWGVGVYAVAIKFFKWE